MAKSDSITNDGEIVPLSSSLGLRGQVVRVGWQLPPDLAEDEWKAAGEMLGKMERSVSWWIGDWWVFGESRYGERKAIVENEDWQGPSFQTCMNVGSVCKAFTTSRRREVLGFSHHVEVADLPSDEADALLDWCEETIATVGKPRSVRELRREASRRQKEARCAIPEELPKIGERFSLFCSDVRDMPIEQESVDCIITDPPYPEEFLECFEWLAESAARWLKPGGTLAVMSGQTHLPDVFKRLCSQPDLQYRWTISYLTPGGQAAQIFPRKVNSFWKPVIVLQKKMEPAAWIGDVCSSAPNDNDKRFHHWGQSESGIATLVEKLSQPGDVICDPFLGGGTTALVAVQMNRLFIGGDIDSNNVRIASARLSEDAV